MTTVVGRGPIVLIGPRQAAGVRLLCVPFAGAGAGAYRTLPSALPGWVEVYAARLPGRESRLAEPPLAHIDSVVEEVLTGLASSGFFTDPRPYALFGHSMGALVCFEVARSVRRHGLPDPVTLLVSGRRAPHIPDEERVLHMLPEAEFLAAVQALNGIPDEVMREPGLLDLISPALRADFAVCETYRHEAGPALPYRISVFGGASDPTTTPDWLRAWSRHSAGPFSLRLYAGDHFFLHTHHREMAACIANDLTRAMP